MRRSIPTFADVAAAATRLKGVAVETPLIESPALNERVQARVFLKLELLQRTGSFKFRGAYNRLVQLTPAERTARRGRVLLGQSRAGRGGGRAPARHAGHDRHARRMRRASSSRTRARSAPRSSSMTASATSARRSRHVSRPRRARSSCPRSTILTSWPGRARLGSRSHDQARGARRHASMRCSCPAAAADCHRASRLRYRTRAPTRGSSPSSPKASTARGCRSNGASGLPQPETATASPIR